MNTGTELETLLRRLIREELTRMLDGDAAPANDDDDVLRRFQERSAKLRKARTP